MRFADWMKQEGKTDAQVARDLSCTSETIRRYRVGEREPSLRVMSQIFDLTAGAVAPNDWCGIDAGAEAHAS